MKPWRNFAVALPLVLCSVAPAPSAPRIEPDKLTPADAELVVAVNVRQILDTPAAKKHALDPLKLLLQRKDGEIQQLLTAAGLDPLRDIDTIGLSASGNPATTGKLLIVVRGRFDPDKARTAIGGYVEKHPDRVKVHAQGDLPIWEIAVERGAKPLFAAFAGKTVLVMTASKGETAAAVGRANRPAQPLNQGMRAALDRIKGGESAWLAMAASDQVKKALKGEQKGKSLTDALRSITGELRMADDAQFTLTVHTTDVAAARQIKDKISEVVQFLTLMNADKDAGSRAVRELLENLKLGTDQNDVRARFTLTDAQLEKFAKKQ